MIRSFRRKESEKLFRRQQSRRFGNIGTVARRKLRMLDDAEKIEDMAAVPGNRLETLGGDRKGQHSIRINDQW
ncbi:MAG: type II toxin-antitoxin system RelE/ParE family toxin [Bryobacteraceae bacterium]